MQTFTQIINIFLSLGAFFLGISIFFLIYMLLRKKEVSFLNSERRILTSVFLVSFIGMAGSLIYSNIIGFPPCDWCWYQRVGLYPVVLMSLYALIKKDTLTHLRPYLLLMTVFGGIFSLYHNFVYYTNIQPFPCSATVSCTARYVFEFGFITIPLMALLSFITIFLLLKTNKNIK